MSACASRARQAESQRLDPVQTQSDLTEALKKLGGDRPIGIREEDGYYYVRRCDQCDIVDVCEEFMSMDAQRMFIEKCSHAMVSESNTNQTVSATMTGFQELRLVQAGRIACAEYRVPKSGVVCR